MFVKAPKALVGVVRG